MATVGAIRTAIKTRLEAVISGLTCYDTVPGSITGHAAVIEPETADFTVAMGRGTDTITYALDILVPASDLAIAQHALDEYLSGHGARSIRQAIFTDRSLGLAGVDAHVSGWTGYGGGRDIGGVGHIGARLTLTVHTSGTA